MINSNCLTDTLAIVHTEANCFDNVGYAWEKWNDSTWHSINNSWQFETDLAIFPVLSNAILLGEDQLINTKQLSVFPNPANNFITIITSDENVELSIFTVLGRRILYQKIKKSRVQKIDISNFENGIYLIVETTKLFSGSKKIVVVH